MIFMGRIAVIGDYESICAYESVGFVTYSVESISEARRVFEEIKKGDYPVIFICENYIRELDELYNELCESIIPAVIPIPSGNSKGDYAVSKLKGFVEKAVGTDIIFK